MTELETKIAAWGSSMRAALPAETVQELEEHLREQIAALRAGGLAPGVAFDRAVERLGDSRQLTREFERTGGGWLPASRPVLVILVLTAAMILTASVSIGYVYAQGRITLLLLGHVLLVTTGYLAMIGTALVGLCALVTSRWRKLSAREHSEVRRVLLLLTALGCAVVPPGIVLGAIWAEENLGAAWSWAPVEIGALTIAFAAFFQLAAFWRGLGNESTRYGLAVLGGGAVAMGWGMAKAPMGGPGPLVWACCAVVLAQVMVLFQKMAEEPNDTARLG